MASRIMSTRAFGLMGVILAVAVAAWVVWERAWTSDLDDLNRQFAELYRQGQYAKANEVALRPLTAARAQGRYGGRKKSLFPADLETARAAIATGEDMAVVAARLRVSRATLYNAGLRKHPPPLAPTRSRTRWPRRSKAAKPPAQREGA